MSMNFYVKMLIKVLEKSMSAQESEVFEKIKIWNRFK